MNFDLSAGTVVGDTADPVTAPELIRAGRPPDSAREAAVPPSTRGESCGDVREGRGDGLGDATGDERFRAVLGWGGEPVDIGAGGCVAEPSLPIGRAALPAARCLWSG